MVLNLRLKGDIVSDALSKMKISGITAPPETEDTQLMIQRLEGMLYELQERGLCLQYNFTEDPDPADFHGMQFYAVQPISSILAFRSVQDWGKDAPPTLTMQARAGNNLISSRNGANKLRQVEFSSRHPRGSGNTQRYIRWRTYYPEVQLIPQDCSVLRLRVGEIEDFRIDFAAEFGANESIMFVGVETSSGLTYSERSRTATAINFRLQSQASSQTPCETVRFTVTVSSGRVIIRTLIVEVDTVRRECGINYP